MSKHKLISKKSISYDNTNQKPFDFNLNNFSFEANSNLPMNIKFHSKRINDIENKVDLSIGLLGTSTKTVSLFYQDFLDYCGFTVNSPTIENPSIGVSFKQISQLNLMMFVGSYLPNKLENDAQLYRKFLRGFISNFCDIRVIILDEEEKKADSNAKCYNWYGIEGYKCAADTDDGLIVVHVLKKGITKDKINSIENKLNRCQLEKSRIVNLEEESQITNTIKEDYEIQDLCKSIYSFPEQLNKSSIVHIFYYNTNKLARSQINSTSLSFISSKITCTLRKSPKRFEKEKGIDFTFLNMFKSYYTFFIKQLYSFEGDEVIEYNKITNNFEIIQKNNLKRNDILSTRLISMDMFYNFIPDYSVRKIDNTKLELCIYSDMKSLGSCSGKFIDDYMKIEPMLKYDKKENLWYSSEPNQKMDKKFEIKIKNDYGVISSFKVTKDNAKKDKEKNILTIIFPLSQ